MACPRSRSGGRRESGSCSCSTRARSLPSPSITSLLAQLEGVSFTGHHRVFSNALGDPLAARGFTVREVDLGPLRWQNVTGFEHVFAGDFAPPNRDGTVGRALLLRHRLLIDYAGRTLTLLARSVQPPESALRAMSPTPIELNDNGIVVEVKLDDKHARFVIDTGATGSMLQSNAREARVTTRRLSVAGVTLPAFEFYEGTGGIGPPDLRRRDARAQLFRRSACAHRFAGPANVGRIDLSYRAWGVVVGPLMTGLPDAYAMGSIRSDRTPPPE